MHDELSQLRRENAELRRANEILKSASIFFAGSSTPTTAIGAYTLEETLGEVHE